VAFIQGESNSTASETVSGFQANTDYVVTFAAAQRGNYSHGGQDFRVYLDNTLLGTFRPTSNNYLDYATTTFRTTAGPHTIKFAGLDSSGGDNTAFIDNVRITGSPAPGFGIEWLVTDQLGTPRMVFDKTGALANVKRHDYLPFGEELSSVVGLRSSSPGYSAADGVRQKFTSKERDIETGLDYFGVRYYSSPQGRFTSVDPYDVNLERQDTADQGESQREFSRYISQPQHWNHYTYVLNNPLKFIDPDGRSEDNTFHANLLGQDVTIVVDKKILKQDSNALAKVKESITKAFDKINQANKDKPFTQGQLDSIHRLDNIQVTANRTGAEGMVGNTFYLQFNHATNPNIYVLSGDIMHDSRHAEQAARGLSYNEKTAIPMEMEASTFVLGIIETRGWSNESINGFRQDAAQGHLPPNSGWKDKSTANSRHKVFDRMSDSRKK
jgi:RHS repeat-associated protein